MGVLLCGEVVHRKEAEGLDPAPAFAVDASAAPSCESLRDNVERWAACLVDNAAGELNPS